jgi:hypothetical protein
MLHKLSSSYAQIAKHIPQLKLLISPGEQKRRLLFQMAKRGDPRPTQKTAIGRSLSQYTSPANTSYKKDFHDKIRKIRPDWFLSQTQIADQKKKELLDMAKRGDPRPSHDKTKIGQALSNYTRKSSAVYDAAFHRKLMKLRPDWFVPQGKKHA